MNATSQRTEATGLSPSVIWDSLESSQLSLLAVFDRSLQEVCGIGYLWFRVLDALAQSNDGLRLQDLAEKVYHSQSGTTRLVDRLVGDGLVERRNCAADRRVIYAILTASGREKHAAAQMVWQKLLQSHFWDALDAEERSALQRISAKLAQNGAKPVCLHALKSS